MPKNRKNERIKNILLLFVSILFSLVLAEIIISNFFQQDLQKYKLDPDMVHRPRENSVVRLSGPEFSVVSRTNSKGLVDYEHDYDFSGLTIAMLGDSFTEASHVNLEEGFTKILETRLRKKITDSRVVNCGIGNTGTDQQYIFLKMECIKYNPDIVILNFYIGNDFANNYASLIYGYENGELVDNRPIQFSSFQKFFHGLNTRYHTIKLIEKILLDGNLSRTILFQIGLYKAEEPESYDINLQDTPFLDSAITDISYEKTQLILDELYNYTQSNGIRLVVTLIPTKEQVVQRKYEEHFSVYNNTGTSIDISKPNRWLAKYFTGKNISYIDLTPYFKYQNKNNTFYFEYDEHFNKEGHQFAADLIYERLLKSKIVS